MQMRPLLVPSWFCERPTKKQVVIKGSLVMPPRFYPPTDGTAMQSSCADTDRHRRHYRYRLELVLNPYLLVCWTHLVLGVSRVKVSQINTRPDDAPRNEDCHAQEEGWVWYAPGTNYGVTCNIVILWLNFMAIFNYKLYYRQHYPIQTVWWKR